MQLLMGHLIDHLVNPHESLNLGKHQNGGEEELWASICYKSQIHEKQEAGLSLINKNKTYLSFCSGPCYNNIKEPNYVEKSPHGQI